MIIFRAYKTELDPSKTQRALLLKHAGVARFAYNWGLTRSIDEYTATGRFLNANALDRELNRLKKTEFPWMYEVSKCATQQAFRNLDRAFQSFFAGRSRFPQFKSKKRGVGRFRLYGSIKIHNDCVQLPRLGLIKLKEKEYLPRTSSHILAANVSEHAGHWFVSIQVEEEAQVPMNQGPAVGVDVGVLRLATISDGTCIENPKALNRYGKKLRRLQRNLSRKRRDSRNREKTKKQLARCHYRISCIRRDTLHKATTMLARTKSVIVLEDLAVKELMKNHRLARSLADASWGAFHRMLGYKAQWHGGTIVKADRFFPSTRRCSTCGHVKAKVTLSQRTFRCDICGAQMDRDLNAALNLEQVAASWAETQNACQRREVHGQSQVLTNEAGTGTDQLGMDVS